MGSFQITPRLTVLVLGAALAGCASLDTVKTAPLGDGVPQTFDATYDRTTAATLKALAALNITITSSTEDATGTIYLVVKPLTVFSWGEVGRVYVKKTSAPPTTVFVNWKKRDQLQLTGTSEQEFANTVFTAVSNGLAAH